MRKRPMLTMFVAATMTLAPIPSMAAEADPANLPNVAQPSPLLGAPSQSAVPSQDAASLQGTPSHVANLRELDALHSQIALLKAQLEIAKLKQGITDAGKPSGAGSALPGGGFHSPFGAAAPTNPLQGASPLQAASLPRVLSISGSGGNLSALLSMPDGGEMLVRPGMKLAGGMAVRRITANGVEVSGRHGLEGLPFAPGQASSGQGERTISSPSFAAPTFASPVSLPPMGGLPGSVPPMGPGAPQAGVPSADGGE